MTTASAVSGSCFCGAVRFSVGLPTLFCGHCHCSMCRRVHGAGYVTWISVPRGRFTLHGDASELVVFASSSHGKRAFCSRCGSSLLCESSLHPDRIDVTLASLHGPIDREPQVHVHFDDHARWVKVDDDLPRLGGKSGLEPAPGSG